MRIDKDVPLPEKKATIIDKMKVRDSIFCETKAELARVIGMMRYRDYKVERHKEGDGFRAWRVG